MSFETAYRTHCKKRGEDPDWAAVYKGLDEVWAQIEARKDLQAPLNPNRHCIVIPRSMVRSDLPTFFYDTIAEGEPVCFCDLVTDKARAELIRTLAAQEAPPPLVEFYGGMREFVQWKLRRLEKRYELGSWEAFMASYN